MQKKEGSFDVFVSHASADAATADEIRAHLESRGLTCWIAPRNVRHGKDYSDEIMHGIEQSAGFILIVSQAANASTHVKRELERAVSYGKRVFPIRIEDVPLSKSLEYFISHTHWLDAWKGDIAQELEQLAQEIAQETEAALSGAPLKQIKLRKAGGDKKAYIIGGGVAALLAAVAAFTLWPSPPAAEQEAPVTQAQGQSATTFAPTPTAPAITPDAPTPEDAMLAQIHLSEEARAARTKHIDGALLNYILSKKDFNTCVKSQCGELSDKMQAIATAEHSEWSSAPFYGTLDILQGQETEIDACKWRISVEERLTSPEGTIGQKRIYCTKNGVNRTVDAQE